MRNGNGKVAKLQLICVPKAEVRMVEEMYEETNGRVVCGPVISV